MTSNAVIAVLEDGQTLTFAHTDLTRFHGFSFPGGVAHAFKVMQRAFPALGKGELLERREIRISTPFRGIGGRDAFELVTRAWSDKRYNVDPSLERTGRGSLSRYYFEISYRDSQVALQIRDGLVDDEFVYLEHKSGRSKEEDERLAVLKDKMSQTLLTAACEDVYDIVSSH